MTEHARPPIWLAIAIMVCAVAGAIAAIVLVDRMTTANVDICWPALKRCQIAVEVTV